MAFLLSSLIDTDKQPILRNVASDRRIALRKGVGSMLDTFDASCGRCPDSIEVPSAYGLAPSEAVANELVNNQGALGGARTG